jgi:hypothetical protein
MDHIQIEQGMIGANEKLGSSMLVGFESCQRNHFFNDIEVCMIPGGIRQQPFCTDPPALQSFLGLQRTPFSSAIFDSGGYTYQYCGPHPAR